MALLVVPLGPPDIWRRRFSEALPEMDIRMAPDVGNPADIEFAAVTFPPKEGLGIYPNLRLIASIFAGQDILLSDKTIPAHVPIVRTINPSGDAMMSETVLLHVLRHHRDLPEYLLSQQRRQWHQISRRQAKDRKVGIMGLGALGLAAAKILRNHGFDVAGWTRRPRRAEGLTVFHGRDQLDTFLARSEIVVILLPLTSETKHLFNRDNLTKLPKGASLINLGRGHHVVDEDLIAALDCGHLAGATLDAFRTEPLPAESPLWVHPRITITPHVSMEFDLAGVARQVAVNVRRLQRGEPLLALVDRAAGY